MIMFTKKRTTTKGEAKPGARRAEIMGLISKIELSIQSYDLLKKALKNIKDKTNEEKTKEISDFQQLKEDLKNQNAELGKLLENAEKNGYTISWFKNKADRVRSALVERGIISSEAPPDQNRLQELSKEVEKITTKAVRDYFDNGREQDGINRYVDQIRAKERSKEINNSADTIQSFIDTPNINSHNIYVLSGPFTGGKFTKFLINIVSIKATEHYYYDAKSALPIAVNEMIHAAELFVGTVIQPALEATNEKDAKIVNDALIKFMNNMEASILNNKNPTIYDLYAYLFYNPNNPLGEFVQTIKKLPSESKRLESKPFTFSERQLKQMNEITKLFDRLAKNKQATFKNKNAIKEYLLDFEKILNLLNQYEKTHILSQDHYFFLKRQAERFGVRAAEFKAALKAAQEEELKKEAKNAESLLESKNNPDPKSSDDNNDGSPTKPKQGKGSPTKPKPGKGSPTKRKIDRTPEESPKKPKQGTRRQLNFFRNGDSKEASQDFNFPSSSINIPNSPVSADPLSPSPGSPVSAVPLSPSLGGSVSAVSPGPSPSSPFINNEAPEQPPTAKKLSLS